MQIGQLVVPDIFAVLVNFTLAAQQIAKITTLYTSPSVARLPRLLPLLIRAPVIARQVPALSVHVLDPSPPSKKSREKNRYLSVERERERERRIQSRLLGGNWRERRGRAVETNIAMFSGRRKVRPVMPYNIYSSFHYSAPPPPSRRSIGFPSLLPPHPSGAPVHLHLLHSPLDSLRWTFLNHERPNEKKKEKRRRRRWWLLSLPFFFSSTEPFSSQIYIFSIFRSFFSSFSFYIKKSIKKKRCRRGNRERSDGGRQQQRWRRAQIGRSVSGAGWRGSPRIEERGGQGDLTRLAGGNKLATRALVPSVPLAIGLPRAIPRGLVALLFFNLHSTSA